MEIKSSEMLKMEAKIIDGVFQYFGWDSQDEIDLANKFFENVDIEDEKSLISVTPKALELPFNEQLHLIMAILSYGYYMLSDDSVKTRNMGKFLGQEAFRDHRDIISTIVDNGIVDDEHSLKLSEFESKYNIKIVDVSRDFCKD